MIAAVADTHAVLWFLYGSPLLSVRASAAMNRAGSSGQKIGVSSISLAELVYLSEKGRIDAGVVPEVLQILENGDVFQEVPVSSSVVRHFSNDIHQVGNRNDDLQAELTPPKHAGDFPVAVVGTAIDVVRDEHGPAIFQPPHRPDVREPTITFAHAIGNNILHAFGPSDLVGRGEPTASSLAWRLPFLRAACVLPLLFGAQ